MADKNNRKLCMWDKKPCIEDKCVGWVQIQVAIMSPLGVPLPSKPVPICVLPALLMVMGSQRAPTPSFQLPKAGMIGG